MKTLVKYHPLCIANRNAGSNVWTVVGDFEMLPGVSGNTFFFAYHETYFDLAGLSIDDKTLFFSEAKVQAGLLPLWTGAAQPGESVKVWDVMSSIPIQIDSNTNVDVATYGLGYPGSRSDFEHIIFGRMTQYVTTQDIGAYGSPLLSNVEYFGSGMPTASDRVYSYRFVEGSVADAGSPVTSLALSQARHILTAIPKEEPDYEYMMRLKRSYDLQQEPDVDWMMTNLFAVWRGIEGHPLVRAVRFGAEVGVVVGTKAGEATARRIVQEGAATGPVFTPEYFEYEISAIRMGAQI